MYLFFFCKEICISDQSFSNLYYFKNKFRAAHEVDFYSEFEKKWDSNCERGTGQDIHKFSGNIYSIKLNSRCVMSQDRRNSFYRLLRNYAQNSDILFCGDRFELDNESSPARNLICCNVNTFASRADWISETITQCQWATGTGHDGTWIECLLVTRELTAIICEQRVFAESKLIISLSSDFDAGWMRKNYFHVQSGNRICSRNSKWPRTLNVKHLKSPLR